jgi:hypothetical protein
MRSNPITHLIEIRCKQLSLDENDLLRALGYQNLAKGHRRLQEWSRGTKLYNIDHIQKPLERVRRYLSPPRNNRINCGK